MYPAQTSLIPATVALAKFAEQNGFGGLYPYWYLGSAPFNYLTGPVVPGILVALHRVLPSSSLFDLSLFTVYCSLLIASVGWGFFAWYLSKNKLVGLVAGVLTFLLPWHWISGLALSELSNVVASSLVPWVLFAFTQMKNEKLKIKNLLLTSIIFTLLLLANTVSSIPAIIGLILLGILAHKWEQGLKRVGIVIVIGWVLTLWWYTPGYWLNILATPSLGGRPAFSAFVWVVDLLRGFVPFILAIVVILWGTRIKDVYLKFSLAWFGGFALLSLIRFFADPDFWMDWTVWMGEVEVGLALLIASQISNIKYQISKILLFAYCLLLLVTWFFAWQYRDFWLPRTNIDNTVEKRIADKLNEVVKPGETVFLSGTTSFWLNSFSASWRIAQVRGGVDRGATHPKWREAVWELREGDNPAKSERWIRELGIDYIVVHTEDSEEFYHDFAYLSKFEEIISLDKVYEREGDAIYKVRD